MSVLVSPIYTFIFEFPLLLLDNDFVDYRGTEHRRTKLDCIKLHVYFETSIQGIAVPEMALHKSLVRLKERWGGFYYGL